MLQAAGYVRIDTIEQLAEVLKDGKSYPHKDEGWKTVRLRDVGIDQDGTATVVGEGCFAVVMTGGLRSLPVKASSAG